MNPYFSVQKEKAATREGLGEGLLLAAKKNKKIVAVTADLGGSTKLTAFRKKYPSRFIQVGVAEQNLATVASGMAHVGFIPFITSFSMFSPGRNWEQIRTTIAYNNQPVKIASTHAGLGVGEDGATHQALEDVAIMRAIPNIEIIVPCDKEQAKKAVVAAAQTKKPTYLRFFRQKTPLMTTAQTPFEIGKAQIVEQGQDIALIASGPLLYETLLASKLLAKKGISATVVNMHTIKPLDEKTLLSVATTTKKIVTIEDHQSIGGLGSAVAEVLTEHYLIPLVRMGVKDAFGESGKPEQLYKKHRLTAEDIAHTAQKLFLKKV